MKNHNGCDLNNEQSLMEEEIGEEFIVEEVVAKRFNNKTKQFEYLLKWEGYPSEQNTWEPYTNLSSCRYLIQEYEKRVYKRHFRKSHGLLQKSVEQHDSPETISSDCAEITCVDTKKSTIKSLITVDGSVISSDSAEWVNHIDKINHTNDEGVSEHVDDSPILSGDTTEHSNKNHEVNECDGEKSATGTHSDDEEYLQLANESSGKLVNEHSNSSETENGSYSVNSSVYSAADIEDMSSCTTSLMLLSHASDIVAKKTSHVLPSDEIDAENADTTTNSEECILNSCPSSDLTNNSTQDISDTSTFLLPSARTGPLPPPKKRPFNSSAITVSSSGKTNADVSPVVLVSSASYSNSVVSSRLVSEDQDLLLHHETSIANEDNHDNSLKTSTLSRKRKFDDEIISDLSDDSKQDILSSKETDLPTSDLKLEQFIHLSGGIYKKDDTAQSTSKCEKPSSTGRSLIPENRTKIDSLYLCTVKPGIYIFDKDEGINHLKSDNIPDFLRDVITDLMETERKVILVNKTDPSIVFNDPKIHFDMSSVFKVPEITASSGTILQKDTAVSLGIYPQSKSNSDAKKLAVQRGATLFTSSQGLGTIRTKHTPILPKPSSGGDPISKLMQGRLPTRHTPILPKPNSGGSKMDGVFRTPPNYFEHNKMSRILKRGSEPILNTITVPPFDKRNSSKTGTSNLRKLLGTFNPNRRIPNVTDPNPESTDISIYDDVKEISDAECFDSEDIQMEDDFPKELNLEPLSPPRPLTLDPVTGIKLTLAEGELILNTTPDSTPEVSPNNSPRHNTAIGNEVQLSENNAVGMILKAAGQDNQNNSVRMNIDSSAIDCEAIDANTSVVLQVEMGNEDSNEKSNGDSVGVNMASITCADGSVIQDNLVTITGEDGLLYQVANAKIDGDTILVSPEEEPQCIYEMPDGNRVVRRIKIDGSPIFTVDDPFSNSILQLNINEVNVLSDGSQIVVKQDESGHTVQIDPPQAAEPIPELIASLGSVPVSPSVSESIQENALTVVDNMGAVQEVVATLLEAGDPSSEGGPRQVVLLMPDGNIMMTEVYSLQR